MEIPKPASSICPEKRIISGQNNIQNIMQPLDGEIVASLANREGGVAVCSFCLIVCFLSKNTLNLQTKNSQKVCLFAKKIGQKTYGKY